MSKQKENEGQRKNETRESSEARSLKIDTALMQGIMEKGNACKWTEKDGVSVTYSRNNGA